MGIVYVPCSSVNSPCAAFTGGTYKCQGHTELRIDQPPVYEDYKPGDIVETPDLNVLRAALAKELEARKKHVLYSSKNYGKQGTNVEVGDIIDHEQQNVVADCIEKLSRFVNLNKKYGDTTLGDKD